MDMVHAGQLVNGSGSGRVLETVQKQLATAPRAESTAAGVNTAQVLVDMYGNHWELSGGVLSVLPAQTRSMEAQPRPVSLPSQLKGDVRTIITTDDNGFIWAGARGTRHLFRLNPRGPGYTGRAAPELFAAQQRYDPTTSAHTVWQRYEPPLDVTLEGLSPSTTGLCAIGAFSDGVQYELSITGHGVSSATPLQPGLAQSGLRWRAIGARLECGNHDVTAAEVGGRVFISGGAMHYRGFPAAHWEFDELWSLSADDIDRPFGWRTETHFPPAPPQGVTPREYNGLCTVGSELWIVGGSISASQPAATRPDDRVPMTSVVAYDTISRQWRALPSLLRARDACVAEYVDGRIWAMCGVGVDTIESIAPADEDCWKEEVDLQLPAGWDCYNVACVLQRKIYLFGNGGLLSFTPATRQWDASLPPPPVSFSSRVLNARLLVPSHMEMFERDSVCIVLWHAVG